MTDKSCKASKDCFDATFVNVIKSERDKTLLDVEDLTQSLDNLSQVEKYQKNTDFDCLKSDLTQLMDQYLQSTSDLINNTDLVLNLEQDNLTLSEGNDILSHEVSVEMQLIADNQSVTTKTLQELTAEKEALNHRIAAIRTKIEAKQAENQVLELAIAELKQVSSECKPLEKKEILLDPLLREKAQIADLFINLKLSQSEEIRSSEVALQQNV